MAFLYKNLNSEPSRFFSIVFCNIIEPPRHFALNRYIYYCLTIEIKRFWEKKMIQTPVLLVILKLSIDHISNSRRVIFFFFMTRITTAMAQSSTSTCTGSIKPQVLLVLTLIMENCYKVGVSFLGVGCVFM